MTDKAKKTWKIVAVVVVVLIIMIVLYMFFGGGNKYASGSSIRKAKSGKYGKYSEFNSGAEWPALKTAVDALDAQVYFTGAGYTKGEAYGVAWLKGMDIAPTAANVSEFQGDISKYVANEALRKPHWEVSTGSFLNA